MKITISEKLRPYSHTPGAQCVIPGTHFILEAYPALLRVGPCEIPLQIQGPVKNFTVQQDLEKNCVWVFCKEYRFQIRATEEGFEVVRDGKKSLFPMKLCLHLPQKWERLSLGMQKAQDWDLVWRRFDLREILPVLFSLGQKIPPLPSQPLTGTARLLDAPLDIFCRAAFHHILVPRLRDDQHQGLCPDEETTGHPFYLLQESIRRIRALFVRENDNRLQLLPNCPFDAGRMADIQTSFGSLDLEWAKGVPRRAVLRATAPGEVFLDLQPQIKRFRVGRRVQDSNAPLHLEEGHTYFLDRFQK